MKLPEEQLFEEVCADVVIRFKGHGAYKGRAGALKAFRKRAPTYDPLIYETAFDKFCLVYDLAVITIGIFPSNNESNGKYAEFEDIYFEKCMDYLRPLSGINVRHHQFPICRVASLPKASFDG